MEKSHTTAHNLGKKEEKRRRKYAAYFSEIPFFFHGSPCTYLLRGDIFRDASEFDCRLFSVKWAFPPPREKNLSRSFDPPFFLHLFSRMKGKEGKGDQIRMTCLVFSPLSLSSDIVDSWAENIQRIIFLLRRRCQRYLGTPSIHKMTVGGTTATRGVLQCT